MESPQQITSPKQ